MSTSGKKLRWKNGNSDMPIQVDSAVGDGNGLQIDTNYLKKTEMAMDYNNVSVHFALDTSVNNGPEFTDYPYVGYFELSRITASTAANVTYSDEQVNSGQFAPICQTKDDHRVYLYAKSDVTPGASDVIVVPTISIGAGAALVNDATVIDGSNNPVTSNAVYDALHDWVKTTVPSGAVFTDTHVTAVGNHYTPTGTTSKDASGGTLVDIANSSGTQVVTGVNIDAAGHVTGVKSTALKATNSQYAVNNGTLTIQKNGSNVASFTANQSDNATANIKIPKISVGGSQSGSGTATDVWRYINIADNDGGGSRKIAWGKTGDSHKDGYYRVDITFNAEFTTAVESVVVLPWGANADAPSNGWKLNGSDSIRTDGCSIYMDAAWDTIRGLYWIAIGY